MPTAPTTDDFRAELHDLLKEASRSGQPHIDVNAGELHRRIGNYPDGQHRMPTCCGVMREEMRGDDTVLREPLKGKGASVTIRYRLPR